MSAVGAGRPVSGAPASEERPEGAHMGATGPAWGGRVRSTSASRVSAPGLRGMRRPLSRYMSRSASFSLLASSLSAASEKATPMLAAVSLARSANAMRTSVERSLACLPPGRPAAPAWSCDDAHLKLPGAAH
jgi:hypothetical protein